MFHIQSLLNSRQEEKNVLYGKYINPFSVKSARRVGVYREYVKGEGAYLFDKDGNSYLDCDAGGGVFNIGRNHPKIREAIYDILELNTPNMVYRDTPLLAGLLAEALAQSSTGDLNKAIFTTSGSEATEAALKFSRRLTGRPRFLYVEGDFHGLTYGAMSVTDADFMQQGFKPMLPGCECIPRNDVDRLQKELSKGDVAGLIVEPIQGINVQALSEDFLIGAQHLCNNYGTVFIVDEVFVGFGRTGKFLSCGHFGIQPDLLILSKAMSGGYFPIGALMIRDELHARVFNRSGVFVHGSTFSYNDFGMVSGLATLKIMEEENLVSNAASMGQILINGLIGLKERYDMIADVRGRGLIVGIELKAPRSLNLRISGKVLEQWGLLGHMIMMQMLEKHRILCVAVSRNNVLRLTPPLGIGEKEVAYILSSLESVLQHVYRTPDGISRVVLLHLMKLARGR